MSSVKDHHPDYDRYLPLWQRCADVVEGQDAVRAGGVKYLDKLTEETSKSYNARISRSDFFNATWRTIAGLTGMAFRKPPTMDIPAGIASYLPDIDMSGTALNALAKDLVEDVLEYGRMGLLVDHPPLPENVTGLTLAANEALGNRPTIQLYEASHIINWRFARVRNAWTLVMVVLQESASIAEDRFSHKSEVRYRVLELDEAGAYRQQVWRIDDKGKDEQVGNDIYPLMAGKRLGYIPFKFVGANGKADKIDEPPLIDLVDANIAHYQVNSDYRHGLHFTGLPTLFLAGVTQEGDKQFYIGSGAAITTPDPAAHGEYIEFTGQGLEPSEKALDRIERRMAVLGARMLADETQRQPETATGANYKHSGENSVLSAIVIAVSESIEWALGIFAQWAGASGPVVYQINREFMPAMMGPQELTALVGAWQAGAISEAELFMQLQRGDVIGSEKTLEEHQAEVEIAALPAPVAPVADKQEAA